MSWQSIVMAVDLPIQTSASPMPFRLFLLACVASVSAPVLAQDALPPCASLLTEAEVRSACGVSDVVFEVSRDNDTACQISAQREGAVSALMVTLAVQDNVQGARMSVDVARSLGQASDESRGTAGDTDDAEQAIGQVFELLGVQDAGAPEAQDVSNAESAMKDLPALGDGGVRYVSDATAGMGIVNHTIVFSSGATLIKLESGIVAGRAGVCTVETLEPLARLIADRL